MPAFRKTIIFVLIASSASFLGCRPGISRMVGHYQGVCVIGKDPKPCSLDIYPDEDRNPTSTPGLIDIAGMQSFEVEVSKVRKIIVITGAHYSGNSTKIKLKTRGNTLIGTFPFRIHHSWQEYDYTDTDCEMKLIKIK
jgi:hypothetical protein